MRTHVSFRFDNFAGKIPASCSPDQNFTDKVSGNLEGRSLEKLPFEFHDECEGSEGGFQK